MTRLAARAIFAIVSLTYATVMAATWKDPAESRLDRVSWESGDSYRGRVVNSKRKPLEGVTVTLKETLTETLTDPASGGTSRAIATTKTLTDGTFTFAKPTIQRVLTLTFALEGYCAESKDFYWHLHHTSDDKQEIDEVVLFRDTGRLVGVVNTHEGSPLGNVKVVLKPPSEWDAPPEPTDPSTRSDARGKFEFLGVKPGRNALYVFDDSSGSDHAVLIQDHIAREGGNGQVLLRVPPPQYVHGRVLLSNGLPAAHASITLDTRVTHPSKTTADEFGYYRIRVIPGQHSQSSLTFSHMSSSNRSESAIATKVNDEGEPVNVKLRGDDGVMTVEVVDGNTGSPVPNCTVRTLVMGGDSDSKSRLELDLDVARSAAKRDGLTVPESRPSGPYRHRYEPTLGRPFRVVVSALDYAPGESADFLADGHENLGPVVVKLYKATTITGRCIRAGTQEPVSNIQVGLQRIRGLRTDDLDWSYRDVKTLPDGSFTFKGVSSGMYRVKLISESFCLRGFPECTIDRGKSFDFGELFVEATGSISGYVLTDVPSLKGDITTILSRGGKEVGRCVNSANRISLSFHGLPSGDYDLTSTAESSDGKPLTASATVHVPEGSTVEPTLKLRGN